MGCTLSPLKIEPVTDERNVFTPIALRINRSATYTDDIVIGSTCLPASIFRGINLWRLNWGVDHDTSWDKMLHQATRFSYHLYLATRLWRPVVAPPRLPRPADYLHPYLTLVPLFISVFEVETCLRTSVFERVPQSI